MAHSKANEFSNFQIVTIAVFLLGGATAGVDNEDAAVEANRLAPGRFAWRKYPDQINISHISTALSDARKEKNGALVVGSPRDGWRLTPAGLEYSRRHVAELQKADLARAPMNVKERQWYNAERLRMLGEVAFQKFQDGREKEISQREIEAFFRLDDYVLGAARERKIARLLESFSDDPQLGAAVQSLSQALLRTRKGKP